MSQNEDCTSASDSEFSKTSSPSSSDVEQFPKCTSDWDCHFVDKLCVNYKQEDIIRIISSEWALFHLYEEDHLEVERCLNACDLKLNYESLEDLAPDTTTPIEKFVRGWEPNQLQLRVMQTEPLLKKFVFKLDEFNYCLAQIVSENKPDMKISEWKYQCLFEKLLHLFSIYTWTQPFISSKKSQIMGRTVSSKADILCCRKDPALQRPILCVCEFANERNIQVKKTLSDELCPELSPPRKKLRKTTYLDTSNTYIGEHSLWSQHIGELFVYLDKSARNEGILGITVEKTWVRVTFLKVNEPCLEKIRNMPVNRPGSVKLNEDEHPVFFYSERYNFLKQNDRKILFKALLLIRMMQDRFEAGRGATRY